VTDRVQMTVPDGGGAQSGFTVQRSANSVDILAGSLAEDGTGFGITRDEGGVGINAFSMRQRSIDLWAFVTNWTDIYPPPDIFTTCGADITLVQRRDGETVFTYCDHFYFVWSFDWNTGSWNDLTWLSYGWGYPHQDGIGNLFPGDHRLTIWWPGDELFGVHKALQTVDFTVVRPATYFIPAQTGPSSSVVVSGDDGSHPGWKAFDYTLTDDDDCWVSDTLPATLCYKMAPVWSFADPPQKHPTSYSVTARAEDASAAPSAWTVEASNGSDYWEQISVGRSGVTDWAPGQRREYSLGDYRKAYVWWRLNVTEACGESAVAVGNFEVFDRAGRTAPVFEKRHATSDEW